MDFMDYSSMDEARDGPQGDRARAHSSTHELDIQDGGASFDLKLAAALEEANLVKELHQQLTFEYYQDISRVAAQIMVSPFTFSARRKVLVAVILAPLLGLCLGD